MRVTVIPFRTFLCIKREEFPPEIHVETALFKTLTGESYFSEMIELYYSNIGNFSPRMEGVDIFYSQSDICLELEFRELKLKQEFIELVCENAISYSGTNLRKKPEDRADSIIVGSIDSREPR